MNLLGKELLLDTHIINMAEIIETKMLALLREFEGKLSSKVYKDVESLVLHREWGVGLENLCEQLNEFNVPVEADAIERIKELAELMQLTSKPWKSLVKE